VLIESRWIWVTSVIAMLLSTAFVTAAGRPEDDASTLARITEEAFARSQVMFTAFHLSDVYGPRFMDSPGYHKAGEWAVRVLDGYGIPAAQEFFPQSAPGWSFDHSSVEMLEPSYSSLTGVPLARSGSTSGPITGEPVLAIIRNEAEFQAFATSNRNKLKGRIVLLDPIQELPLHTIPASHRLSYAEILGTAQPEEYHWRPQLSRAQMNEADKVQDELINFLREQGVGAEIHSGVGDETFPADAGQVRVTYAALLGQTSPPSVAIEAEQYNRIVRLITNNIPVRLRVNLSTQFYSMPHSFNVVAEIKSAAQASELVMVGAHLDSWQGATGATDNAAGCAIVMDAMRILKSLNLKMDRTVRMVLWDGEEQGEVGSKAYVKEHFADLATSQKKPEYYRLSVYFNVDSGSGKVRGFTAQKNLKAQQVLQEWITPLKDLDVVAVTPDYAGGSDHTSFDKVGLPAFPTTQDPLEYDSISHHTNMDVYDRLRAENMKQAAAVVAWMLYKAATAPKMMPRGELPAQLR
jgi:carboxypeptidase Q